MKHLALVFFVTITLQAYEKVIALSPAISEIVFALGAQDKLIANTRHSSYPKEAETLPKVGGYFSPSLEKILALQPDLVIMQESSRNIAHKLNKLEIATRVVRIDTMESINDTIQTVGKLLDRTAQAAKLVGDIQNALEGTKGIVQDKKILFVIGHNVDLTKEIYVAGQNLYLDDIIEASGNTNALQSKRRGQPVLNLERVIALNPDIIILLSPYMEQNGLNKKTLRAPWEQLPMQAAKTGNIFVQSNEYAGIASHRVIKFINDFKRYLLEVKD